MKCQNLEIEKKTTKVYELTFKKDGTVEDITDWTIYFTVKENVEDDDDDAEIKKSITSHTFPTTGTTEIDLSISDTNIAVGNYYYSIDYKDDEGNIGTILRGRLKIISPVLQTKS